MILIVGFFFFEITQAAFYDEQIQPSLLKAQDSQSLSILFVGILGVGITQPQDDDIREKHRHNQKMNETLAEIGDVLGTGIPGLATVAVQYYWDRPNSYSHLRALIFTDVTTKLMKFSFARKRPGSSPDRKSFPSGHTSTSFASATSLTYAYGWNAAVIAYPLALLSAYSRLAEDVHWGSDLVAGATVGILWGRATYMSQNESAESTLARYTPILGPRFLGVTYISQF